MGHSLYFFSVHILETQSVWPVGSPPQKKSLRRKRDVLSSPKHIKVFFKLWFSFLLFVFVGFL